jgi:predicted TIM-barrel fold metal-dependent hydrolase
MANLVDKLVHYGGDTRDVPPPRPEPGPREIRYRIVSVDDHVLEPPEVFRGRMPAGLADRAPRVDRDDAGVDWWVVDDERFPLLGADALVTWEMADKYLGPLNFDQVRRGAWDIDARVHDMDLCGIAASLTFPSAPWGFAGQRFLRMRDRDLALAAMRAYNSWVIEDWSGTHPGRIIPQQVVWLADVEVAAREVRANADRGFRAITFSENPEKLGLPSLHSGHWDPLFAACEETETVINLHVGSSSETLVPSADSPPEVLGLLFNVNAFAACVDWLYAQIPVRFPGLRIALSESGLGWIPMLLDKLEYMARGGWSWDGAAIEPIELLHRNFWFSTYYDPRALPASAEVGMDRIMVETDYPHYDSSWPDTQDLLDRQLRARSAHEVELLTHRNAEALYRFRAS